MTSDQPDVPDLYADQVAAMDETNSGTTSPLSPPPPADGSLPPIWVRKAATAIAWQARKLKLSPRAFAAQFGFSVEQLAAEAERAFAGACPYCCRPFSEMPRGISDLTLDVIDRDQPPAYSNCIWCCSRCAGAHGQVGQEQWTRMVARMAAEG